MICSFSKRLLIGLSILLTIAQNGFSKEEFEEFEPNFQYPRIKTNNQNRNLGQNDNATNYILLFARPDVPADSHCEGKFGNYAFPLHKTIIPCTDKYAKGLPKEMLRFVRSECNCEEILKNSLLSLLTWAETSRKMNTVSINVEDDNSSNLSQQQQPKEHNDEWPHLEHQQDRFKRKKRKIARYSSRVAEKKFKKNMDKLNYQNQRLMNVLTSTRPVAPTFEKRTEILKNQIESFQNPMMTKKFIEERLLCDMMHKSYHDDDPSVDVRNKKQINFENLGQGTETGLDGAESPLLIQITERPPFLPEIPLYELHLNKPGILSFNNINPYNDDSNKQNLMDTTIESNNVEDQNFEDSIVETSSVRSLNLERTVHKKDCKNKTLSPAECDCLKNMLHEMCNQTNDDIENSGNKCHNYLDGNEPTTTTQKCTTEVSKTTEPEDVVDFDNCLPVTECEKSTTKQEIDECSTTVECTKPTKLKTKKKPKTTTEKCLSNQKSKTHRKINDANLSERDAKDVLDLVTLMNSMKSSFFERFFDSAKQQSNAKTVPTLTNMVIKMLDQMTSLQSPNGFIAVISGGKVSDLKKCSSDLVRTIKLILKFSSESNTIVIVTASCPCSEMLLPLLVSDSNIEAFKEAQELYDIPQAIKSSIEKLNCNDKESNAGAGPSNEPSKGDIAEQLIESFPNERYYQGAERGVAEALVEPQYGLLEEIGRSKRKKRQIVEKDLAEALVEPQYYGLDEEGDNLKVKRQAPGDGISLSMSIHLENCLLALIAILITNVLF